MTAKGSEQGHQARFWADEEADLLATDRQHVIRDSKTPSGAVPISGLRGPKFYQQDMALAKGFALTEKLRATLRAEAYNLFNRTNLGMPANNVTANNAGQITALAFGSTMRRMQFALRFQF